MGKIDGGVPTESQKPFGYEDWNAGLQEIRQGAEQKYPDVPVWRIEKEEIANLLGFLSEPGHMLIDPEEVYQLMNLANVAKEAEGTPEGQPAFVEVLTAAEIFTTRMIYRVFFAEVLQRMMANRYSESAIVSMIQEWATLGSEPEN